MSKSSAAPNDWIASTIGDSCEILDFKRIPLNSTERAVRQDPYPYYGANGIQGKIDGYIFEGEHILLAEDGGHFSEYEARSIAYRVDGKFWVNNHAHILKGKSDNRTDWLFYSLEHKNILKFINGGTRAKLNQSDMREIDVLLPPLPEQKKIAEILTSVDNAIKAQQRQIAKLKDLKKAMMQELLTQGVGDEHGNRHTKFKDSPVGRIPVGWECVRLESLLKNHKNSMRSGPFGSALLKRELVAIGHPYLGIDNVHTERFEARYRRFVSDVKYEELSRYAVYENDVMITIMGTVGRCCMVPPGVGKALSSKHVWTMTFDTAKYYPRLMCWQLNFATWIQEQFKNESQGGVMESISSKTLKNLWVPCPPIDEQNKMAQIHLSITDSIMSKQRKLEVTKK